MIMTTKEFINKCKRLFGDVFDFDKTVYVDRDTGLTLSCKICKCDFLCKPVYLYSYKGCPVCTRKKKSLLMTKSNESFIEEAKLLHNNKYSYSKVNYVSVNSPVIITCNECGNEFKQKPKHHLYGFGGCKRCNNKIQSHRRMLGAKEFTKRSVVVHGQSYSYDGLSYKNAKTNVEILCKNCKEIFWQRPDVHLIGGGCPRCKQSLGERKVEAYLSLRNVKYERNKTFSECKSIRMLRFDFYLPELSTIIEYDGVQHFYPTRFGNMSENDAVSKFVIQKENDKKKDEFVSKFSIMMVRIPYYKQNEIEKTLERIL